MSEGSGGLSPERATRKISRYHTLDHIGREVDYYKDGVPEGFKTRPRLKIINRDLGRTVVIRFGQDAARRLGQICDASPPELVFKADSVMDFFHEEKGINCVALTPDVHTRRRLDTELAIAQTALELPRPLFFARTVRELEDPLVISPLVMATFDCAEAAWNAAKQLETYLTENPGMEHVVMSKLIPNRQSDLDMPGLACT